MGEGRREWEDETRLYNTGKSAFYIPFFPSRFLFGALFLCQDELLHLYNQVRPLRSVPVRACVRA